MLQEGDPASRDEAATALAAIGPAAVPGLVDSLKHKDPAVRRAAINASGHVLGYCTIMLDTGSSIGYVPGRGEAVEAYPQIALAVVGALNDPDPIVRKTAIQMLALREVSLPAGCVSRAADAFRKLLHSDDLDTRRLAVDALSSAWDPEAARLLTEALSETDPQLRAEVLSHLTDIIHSCGIPEGDAETARVAAAAISQYIEPKTSIVKLNFAEVRISFLALVRIGEPEGVRAMIKLLPRVKRGFSDVVCEHILKAIRFRRGSGLPRVPSCYVDDLSVALRSECGRDANQATIRLLWFAGDEGIEAISDGLNDEDHQLRRRVLKALVYEPQARINEFVTRAGPQGIAAIDRALREEDEKFRVQLMQHLLVWPYEGLEHFAPVYIQMQQDENPILRRLGMGALGHAAPQVQGTLPVFLAGLDDPDELVRESAVLGLRRLGCAAAVATPRLICLLDNENPSIRAYAAQALAAIGPTQKEARAAVENLKENDEVEFVRTLAGRALREWNEPEAPPNPGAPDR